MLKPPSIKRIPDYPVTASIAASAITVTGFWWSGTALDHFFMDGRVWADREIWRALTSVLPHVNFLHLAFNLYWLWVFGTILEGAYGHVRFLGIVVVLAFGSGLADFSLFSGGVGLSGVDYGLWAMLWVLSRSDARFAGTIDQRTSATFVVWFFLCIAMTVTDVMPVANGAHGAGALLGALLGMAVSNRGALGALSASGVGLVIGVSIVGSLVLWPQISFSSDVGPELERTGLRALEEKRKEQALELLEMAAHRKSAPARTWYNLGVAYDRLSRREEALAAFEHAAQMPDADRQMRQTAEQMKTYDAWSKGRMK